MSNKRTFAVSTIVGVFLLVPSLSARTAALAPQGTLASATSVKCTFSLMTVGVLGDKPDAKVKPATLVLEFVAVNADEGSAELKSGVGVYDIIVRYAQGYLNFIQSFRDGPLHTTTILDKKTAGGKFKAMHSRHEYTDFALPSFTSSPEQYYGECEVLKAGGQ
jgi:hypothetical protein